MTEKTLKVRELSLDALNALGDNHTQPAFDQMMEEIGGFEGRDIMLVQYAYAKDPEPLGVAHIFKRTPYANPEQIKQDFAGAVERGWLKKVGDGAFNPTEKGSMFVTALLDKMEEITRDRKTLSQAELAQLETLTSKAIQGAMESKAITDKFSLELGRLFIRQGIGTLHMIRRNLVDLLAFRDDAHVAAWREHKIDGYVWETFSYTWEGEAHTPAEMVEKVGGFRHYDEADYAAAYEELVKRGWAVEDDGKYELTDKGKETRQKTEDLTNEYFDTGFALLSGEEVDALIGLLGKLAEALQPVAEGQ